VPSDAVRTWRLKIIEHILHLPEKRLANAAMYVVPEFGKWRQGRPTKNGRWTTFKEDLHERNDMNRL